MTLVPWLEQAVGHQVGDELTKDEAEAVTTKIKGYVGVAWVLLYEAHERKAHKAMGYKTWADYVAAEFDMDRSYSYRLISQAKVVLEISEAAGVSPMGDISEREARDLAPVLDEAKAAAVEATEALPADAPAEDKQAAARDALDRLRADMVAANRPKQDPGGGAGNDEPARASDDPPPPDTTTSGSDQSAPADAAGPGDDEQDESPAPSPAPKVVLDPALKIQAQLSTLRAEVAKWLAFDRHEEAIEQMSPEQRADYRSFLMSVWEHTNRAVDSIDSPTRLKAVK